MSRELFILRHSKSDWDSHTSDHERPLNKRGRENARQIAQWMKTRYLYPGLILCSSALRTRQTLEPIIASLDITDDKIEYNDRLYLAELKTLLAVLRNVDDSESSVMIIAHNPGLEDLVVYLAQEPIPLSTSGKLMPTSCLVHFKLPDDWQNLEHQAQLVSVTRASDISN